jgi:hypothetical protein
MYIWVTRLVYYLKQELLFVASTWVHSRFFCGFRVAYLFTFCVVLLCVFTFWVSCCDARYDFRMESMCGSNLPQVVCGGPVSCLCYLCLFACDGVQCVLCCVFTLFFFVFCALCCQFLLIVHLWLPLDLIPWCLF